jgi:hypothetical protein
MPVSATSPFAAFAPVAGGFGGAETKGAVLWPPKFKALAYIIMGFMKPPDQAVRHKMNCAGMLYSRIAS